MLKVGELRPGRCDVWVCDTGSAAPHMFEVLDETEQRRFREYRRSTDRKRFLVARFMLRIALGGYLGCKPAHVALTTTCVHCGGSHGKPRIKQPACPHVEFSIAHAGNRILVALAVDHPVGVDIEVLRADLPIERLAPLILSAGERQALHNERSECLPRSFMVLWTRKEAVTKAIGCGFTLPPNSFSVSAPSQIPSLMEMTASIPFPQISLQDLALSPPYVGSVAMIGTGIDITMIDGTEYLRQ